MQGIVRRARRPPGWNAPGPLPAGGLGPRSGEDLCYLSGEWRIIQRLDGHRWSLDDLVTAAVAAEECETTPPQRVLDLGCGIGAVLLMLAWCFPSAHLVGIEAQALSVDLARRSIAWNGAADRCTVRLGDFREPEAVPEGPVFDLVSGTPPYLPIGSATESQRAQFGPCHFEHRGGLEAYCETAARLLAAGGRFVTCAGGNQRVRVEAAATAARLDITRRVDVVPRAGKQPLLAVYVLRHAGAGLPPSEATLVVRDAAGQRTAAFQSLRAAMGMPP